jgi:hypothetical protein
MANLDPQLPPRFADLKREIAALYGPSFEACVTHAWKEVVEQLQKVTSEIADGGPEVCSEALPRRRSADRLVDYPSSFALRDRCLKPKAN